MTHHSRDFRQRLQQPGPDRSRGRYRRRPLPSCRPEAIKELPNLTSGPSAHNCETVEKEPLERIAEKIAKLATKADESTIEAALLVREARERVDGGELGKTTWYAWAPKNIELSMSRLRELQRIAKAKDPKAELERIRKQNNERQARHRDKKKRAPLRNGGDMTRRPARIGPKREQLIELARSAPLDHIEKLLSLAQELAAVDAATASDQDVEHVGDADTGDAATEAANLQLAAE